jgi:flagellin
MSRIQSNIAALRAIHRLSRNYDDMSIRLERLATGLRINRGADDPAGLIASERLRSEIRGIQQAIENSARAANVITTTEGALQEVSALLLDLQSLVVGAANDAGMTHDEIRANQLQIDSILESIDRIANTTTFAGRKLLDGSMGYTLSTVPTDAIGQLSIYSARVPEGGARDVTVEVIQSAQQAELILIGGASGSASTTSATTVEIRGNLGGQLLSFVSGTTLTEIEAAINNVTAITGVTATVSTAGGTSALVLNSVDFGSDAFVSIQPVSGNFVESSNAGVQLRDDGLDAGVLVDGQLAATKGFIADVRSAGLDARIYLTEAFGQTLSSATFRITGGGALFQITPQLNPNGQIHFGFNSIATTQLGDVESGLLYTLKSGYENDLDNRQFATAQEIIAKAIDQISSYRGRLGNVHRNQIETAVNSQNVALENVTASESVIRDADMAVEVSALTRAQVLVQSTQRTLQIANSIPEFVLSLLS